MNIYAGNLPYSVDEDGLREIFGQYGEVEEASVIKDRYSGRSKGFGFVVMPNDSEAQAAIDALNETQLDNRPIRVNQAKPRENG
uniref:RNA recognition motif. (A.k.a. RRM, RBD, or RNP domain) n=1 Tax=Candidatus Kentrum sp. DK TaxID=2126562 RepID=A0A450SJ46_9GAMM|nr:MAG: RNA recognition motif. (a.k.a. RRM, RBD, or RNP domain) [Candidatus Kentron sp. DK]VFJ53451.1 MAG: RNA recognition motif. (a.k.a. RRM, RBD, or RNP domain) [Candidatus Kentron sp. DK]